MAGQVVRRLADEPGKRDQRRAGKHEQCQLAGGAEPIQNHDERRQQQRQERTASDVPTGPAHTLTLLGDARSPAFSRSRRDPQLAHRKCPGSLGRSWRWHGALAWMAPRAWRLGESGPACPVTARPVADMMPSVTLPVRPSGLPTASTMSPTLALPGRRDALA